MCNQNTLYNFQSETKSKDFAKMFCIYVFYS